MMKKKILYLILMSCVVLSSSFITPHDVHTSMILIQVNSKNKTAQIKVNIFADELEAAINNANNKAIAYKDPLLKQYILNYLKQKFIIKTNNKIIDYTIKDLTAEDALISVMMQATQVTTLKNAVISNSLLLEIFDDQTNMVKVEENGKTKDLFFDKSNQIQKVNLD